MGESNLEIVQDVINMFAENDLDAALGCMSDNVTWLVPGARSYPFAGTYHGRDEVKAFFNAFGSIIELRNFVVDQYICEGARVVVLGQTEAFFKVSRRTTRSAFCYVVTVEDGRITEFSNYQRLEQ